MRTKEDKFINIQNLDSTQLLSCVFFTNITLEEGRLQGRKEKKEGEREQGKEEGRERNVVGREAGVIEDIL